MKYKGNKPTRRNIEEKKDSTEWEKYAEKLDRWEREMLNGTEEAMLFDAAENLKEEMETMWIVSDGSHKDEKGTFGWVIATDTKVIWQSNGRARG